jgi:glycosyltransferase involved in cell wall biosynthesis
VCAVIVAARDEAATLGATLAGCRRAFPQARLWVADDGSRDATAAIARAAGAEVVAAAGRGKGAAMTAAARRALDGAGDRAGPALFVLCDGDLGDSAARLGALTRALGGAPAGGAGTSERIVVAAFAAPQGGGFGLALGFARRALARRTGFRSRAPMSGQRALRGRTLRALLPFADGYGMELGIGLDAPRIGAELVEVEVELAHRATGRTPRGFAHRGRQLVDMVRALRRR